MAKHRSQAPIKIDSWKRLGQYEKRTQSVLFFRKNIYAFMFIIMMLSGGTFLKRLFIYFSFRRPFRVLSGSCRACH